MLVANDWVISRLPKLFPGRFSPNCYLPLLSQNWIFGELKSTRFFTARHTAIFSHFRLFLPTNLNKFRFFNKFPVLLLLTKMSTNLCLPRACTSAIYRCFPSLTPLAAFFLVANQFNEDKRTCKFTFCSKICLYFLFSIIINLKGLTDVINFMLLVMKTVGDLEQKFDGRRSFCSVQIQTRDLPTHASALLIVRCSLWPRSVSP